jgi:adenylosuccinate synthase
MKADVVLGFVFGDEGKAKVVHDLLKTNDYTHTLRFNGGENAGHTIYINDEKVISHMVPTGAISGIKSIIGPGCALNVESFFAEMDRLAQYNPNIHDCVKIAYNCHIVTGNHLEEELKETKIGTTRKGIGPAYRDKHARTGLRAEDVDALKPYLIDPYAEFYQTKVKKKDRKNIRVLCEGAQALWLDIDWGDYPYCTSSHCGVGAVMNNGVSHKSINKVYGVGKCYETYVGSKVFQTKDPILTKLGDAGNEYGATTGRRRQVNYFNMDRMRQSCKMSGADTLILNKLDVLQKVDVWKVIENDNLFDLGNEAAFKRYIREAFKDVKVIFSTSPYHI